jgi:hypothetical protein
MSATQIEESPKAKFEGPPCLPYTIICRGGLPSRYKTADLAVLCSNPGQISVGKVALSCDPASGARGAPATRPGPGKVSRKEVISLKSV